MANSTWFQATNSVLALAKLPQVPSTTLFDSGPLSKYQQGVKTNLDFAHRHLSLKMATAFTNRKFQLPISTGITDYVLDTGISAESLKYHSWFNITAGSPYAAPLRFMKYEDYTSYWPDQTIIQSAPPEYVVQLPYDRQLDVAAPMPRVRIFPIPDNTYMLQYQARLNPYPLVSSSSIILWPPEYEHGLWTLAWQLTEVDLAEGREALLAPMVDEVISRIRVMSMAAEEVRKGVRLPHLNTRRRWPTSYFR